MSPVTPVDLREALLARVPDEPHHIDTRGLLLEDSELFGDAEGCVAVGLRGWLLAAIGRPGATALEAAIASVRPDAELVATGPAVEVTQAYFGQPGERAFVHEVGAAGLDRSQERADAVLLDARTLLDGLSREVVREIEDLRGREPIGAVLVDGQLASVCYPVLATERYWDVSVETVERFRRSGLAAAAFLRVEREMRGRGLEPVWGAYEGNPASLALAAKLGFEQAGEIQVFEAVGRHSPLGVI